MAEVLLVRRGIEIPVEELTERFVRSSGPGGQNVNKLATAVELRFDVQASTALPEWLRARALARRDRRLTADGVLVIQARRHRSQERNRADARARLLDWLRALLRVDPERIPTRPTRAAERRRIAAKRARAALKRLRRQQDYE